MKITGAKLRDREACEDQVCIFEAEWPAGCTITLKALRRAAVLGLDLDWFAHNFLPHSGRKVYDAARAEPSKVYDAAMAEANKVYDAAMAEPSKVYDAAMAEALWRALKV